MSSIIKRLMIFVIAFSFVSAVAIAADYDPNKGTIVINVTNGNGTEISGNWYLHQGGINGAVPRNGSSGEVFQITPGIYYLEVQSTGTYKAYWLKNTNPQSVSAGQTITFDLAYYTNQEAKDQAQELAAMQAAEAAAEPVVEEAVEPVIEEAVEPPAEEETTEEAVTEEEPAVVIPPAPSVPTVIIDVPTWGTPPSATSATESEGESYDLGAVTSLAQTGPGMLALLIPSSIAGLCVAFKKRK
jgi:hypothetical protein